MTPGPKPRFAVPILFAVVFIDLVGFGILAPLVPFYVERLGARPELITLIIAAHPLAQSLAMPLWGTLSDRRGRRPVLLASMLGHGAAYLLLGFADSLWLLLLARILSGATSANLSTAYAYIADVTTPEERAGAMGRVSSAFGLGFAIGPALGGLLAGGTTMDDANLLRPAIAAAVANRPPSSCTMGRRSGGMTGRTERIIHSGRAPERRKASMRRSRLMAFLRRMPELVRTSE